MKTTDYTSAFVYTPCNRQSDRQRIINRTVIVRSLWLKIVSYYVYSLNSIMVKRKHCGNSFLTCWPNVTRCGFASEVQKNWQNHVSFGHPVWGWLQTISLNLRCFAALATHWILHWKPKTHGKCLLFENICTREVWSTPLWLKVCLKVFHTKARYLSLVKRNHSRLVGVALIGWHHAQCIMGVEVFLPSWQKGKPKPFSLFCLVR